MVTNDKFYVIELLDHPNNENGSCVCVPKSWVKLHRSKEVFVLYPTEDIETTLKRIEDGENYQTSWPLYRGTLKYITDNLLDAKIWKLSNIGSDRDVSSTPQYIGKQSTSTEGTEAYKSMPTCASNPETVKHSNKHDKNSSTGVTRKRKLKSRNAEENQNKQEKQKEEMQNESEAKRTQRTVLTVGDYLKRKQMAISQGQLNPEYHDQKHSFKSTNQVNGPKEGTHAKNKIDNIPLNTQIITSCSSMSPNQKREPINETDDLFGNCDIPVDISEYIELKSDDDDEPCPNEINTLSHNQTSIGQSSKFPRDASTPKSYISVVPDRILYKKNEDRETIGISADTNKSSQKPCNDAVSPLSSRELEYLTNRYYELYDPTNTDQFLSTSACRLYQEISELETHDKRYEGNIVNSVTEPQNNCNGENPKPKRLTIDYNDSSLNPPGKLITSSTDLKRINNEIIQNNLTKKPFSEQVPLDVINNLSEKLSTAGYYVPPCKNVIADPRNIKLRGSNQTTPHKSQDLPENHSIVPNYSEPTEQTNQGQRKPEYQIIVENNSQTNKITILNTTEKESNNQLATSPNSSIKHNSPNCSNTSKKRLSAVSSQKQNNALEPPVRYEYPLNNTNNHTQYPKDINFAQNCSTYSYLANQSYQLSQYSNGQYLSLPQHNHIPQHHLNNINNYRTMDRVHNKTHFEDNRKNKNVTYQNSLNQVTPQLVRQTGSKAPQRICQNAPNLYNHSVCYERPCKQQCMSLNKKSLHIEPGAQKHHSVLKAYPNFTGHTILRHSNNPSVSTSIQSVVEMPNYSHNVTNHSNNKNSLPVTQTQLYQHLQQTYQDPHQLVYRPIENNQVIARQVLQPSDKAHSIDKQVQTNLVSSSKSNLPNILNENPLEMPFIRNTNKSNEENKVHQRNNTENSYFVSQNKSNATKRCSNETPHSTSSRESIQHTYPRCAENQPTTNNNTENHTLISNTMTEIDLMDKILEKVNSNIVKLNLNINTLDLMLNKSNDILEKFIQSFITIMNNVTQYSQINESTASTSKDLRENKTEQTNKPINCDNNNNSDNDSGDENDKGNEEKEKEEAHRGLDLPPEYNPADSRWTLKYQTLGRGLMELVPESRVYIKILDLGRCLRKAKTCKQLARLLLLDIFSQNALRLCSFTGSKPRSSKYSNQDTRPGLDANARKVLVAYVRDYGHRKGWYVPHADIIIASIRGVLQRLRF